MKYVLFGGFESAGISSKNGKAYEICHISVGVLPRSWSNATGSGKGYGYEAKKMDIIKSEALSKKMDNTAFPVLAEVSMEPNPNDPTQNVIVDFDVVSSLFDINSKSKSN
ncbi:hypothetical protein ACODM8_21325 [Vibrio ostreicida]|uniref:hypothetical protein n=1 Tax=Vibrio ostreicida TaxID=526588 RepID=UPI003B5BA8D3